MSDKNGEQITKQDLDRMFKRMARKRRQDGAVFRFDNSKVWGNAEKIFREAAARS